MLIIHIVIAVFGIITSSLLCIAPSQVAYRLSMAALVLTLLSGTALVFSANASLAKTCLSGIIYVSIMSVLIYFGRRKLAEESLDA